MKKLSNYEIEILNEIRKEDDLCFFDKILLVVLKRYTFKIYQKGFRRRYFKK